MKKEILSLTVALASFVAADAQTGADYMQAFKKADTNIAFDVNAEGKPFRVKWGMDTAWDWDFNVNRGINHIGKGNFETGRVSFQPIDLAIDNGDGTYSLTARQKNRLKWRCDLIKKTGTTEVNINCDHEALFRPIKDDGFGAEGNDEFTGRKNYQGKPQEWYKLIKASVAFVREQGLKVVSVSPFNEPDFVWEQATNESQAMKDFLEIAKLLKADPYFDDIRICGGNTLNCDRALPWYNYLKEYLDEGNTHQLAGVFNTYADFFATVKADGKVATADELHNVGEAIVGVEYGMETGIWWGFDSKARGQFCIDSNEGVRIGYGENRGAWSSGAVYRNDMTGEVHGYLGSSERQATPSSYAFISKTKDVFFNGYGPTRMYVYDVPGGTGYQKGQINAERLFDITWGEDVAPGVVDGTYQIMNLSSKKLLTWKGTSNVQSTTRTTSGTTQHWKVYPGYTDGDISYWFIDNVNTSASITKTHLNLQNLNLNSGAGVICWDGKADTHAHTHEEQWYLKYAGDGCYYIISRLSNKYLYCASSTSGTNITANDAPTEKTTDAIHKRYMWRFMPLDAKAETTAPAAPAALSAKQRIGSVELSWTAPADDDVASYTILRGIVGKDGTEWNTIGRNVTQTTFIDNTVIAGRDYIYKVMAVDLSGNRSDASEPLQATPLTENGLLCQLQFDNTLLDNSANHLDASLYGTPNYSKAASQIKSGTTSLIFNGSTYAMLPYSVAHQDEITIATWVRCSSSSAWQRVFDFGNDTEQYMFLTPNNGSDCRFVMKNGGDEQILSYSKKLGTATWYHVTVTIKPIDDKVQAIIYINGEKVAETSDFTIKPSDIAPSLCYIGRSMFNADPMFSGQIDDFRVYNYALSEEEVAAIMEDVDEVSKDIKDDYSEVSTSITNPKNYAPITNGTYYDLNGRPTNNSAKGIVIQNGKKVLQK